MIFLNFAHPLTPEQRTQIETLTGQPITAIIDKMVQLDEQQPLAPQLRRLLDELGLAPLEWQSLPILVNLPGYAPAAACLLAELHGRMGHFPTVVHIRRRAGSTPTVYEAGEVLDLQVVREAARRERTGVYGTNRET